MELVSNKYDPAKWERALTACKEALTAAEAAGYKLFDLEASEAKAAIDKVPLPFIPGKEEDTEENELFQKSKFECSSSIYLRRMKGLVIINYLGYQSSVW